MSQRIVIYGMNYAPEIAGVGRYTGEIGEHFVREGHEVTVVTTPPHYPGWRVRAQYKNIWHRESLGGADVFRCPLYLTEKMSGLKRALSPLSFALTSAPVALWQILRRKPNIVLLVEPTLFTAPIALLAAWMAGSETVLHVQDLEVEAAFAVGHLAKGGIVSRLAAAFDKVVTRAFKRVITISERMASKIQAKGVARDRITVVRNWVNLDLIRPDVDGSAYRAELGLSEGAFVALYSGNLGAKQGVRLLVEAAEHLSSDFQIVLLVAGDGPMRHELEAASKTSPNLKLVGFQPEARFGEFLRAADLHLLPQEREAADLLLPSKLGGMLASGRPIVVTADLGTELADFLGTSCHFTPPGDPEALAAKIKEVAGQPPCRDTEAERLIRAQSLSKDTAIRSFSDAALSASRRSNPCPTHPKVR